jgi:hypothetical protein
MPINKVFYQSKHFLHGRTDADIAHPERAGRWNYLSSTTPLEADLGLLRLHDFQHVNRGLDLPVRNKVL